MFNKKELFSIVSVALVLGTIISISSESIEAWQSYIFKAIGVVFLVIMINVIFKKIMAHYFQAEIEVSLWQFRRWIYPAGKGRIKGIKPHEYSKNWFPAGFFFPLIIKFLSVGLLNWMACLTFDVKGTIYRAARRWGMYQYSEVTEHEMAWIAFVGIFVNIVFAILAYLTNLPLFAKVNLLYAFYNSIPISNLDGTKMFFGYEKLWWISMVVSGIGVVASLVII